jgi:glycosyltransferase involved in cell wall biosynthesis
MSDGKPDLILYDSGVAAPREASGSAMPLDAVVDAGLGGLLKQQAFRYRDVVIRTTDLELMRKPLNKAILLRLLACRHSRVEDEHGGARRITLATVGRLLLNRLHDGVRACSELKAFRKRIAELESGVRSEKVGNAGPALYLRSDLVFGIKSGGSVGHIAGVLNNLRSLLGEVRFYTTDRIPTVDDTIVPKVIRPGQRYADIPETRSLLFGAHMAETIADDWSGPPPRFIYQRYAVNNITGVLLAQQFRTPLVIEYNGSEVWINRHWGKALADEDLALRLEWLSLSRADLVVVVSRALADELVVRGIPAERILVNPNGVDPERYRPDIDNSTVREELGLANRQVIGFIGTFGPWHGAEVLAQAAGRMFDDRPELRERVCFLFIGDGQKLPEVRRIVADHRMEGSCRFTGLVPQADGPAYMAACDMLISPHVPNPDGSRFFGSPTKLFEYMAMGKPIVASALEQIDELLQDGHDAVLVPPGDVAALARAMGDLLDDPDRRARLGAAARQTAEQRFTWRRHTERILTALDERLSAGAQGSGDA